MTRQSESVPCGPGPRSLLRTSPRLVGGRAAETVRVWSPEGEAPGQWAVPPLFVAVLDLTGPTSETARVFHAIQDEHWIFLQFRGIYYLSDFRQIL